MADLLRRPARCQPASRWRRSGLHAGLTVIVDRTKCSGKVVCTSVVPEAILEAAESCPLDAITVIDGATGERLAA